MTTDDPVRYELTQLIDDVFWTEKGHFTLAGWWQSTHLIVGLIATLASGLAGAVIIAQSSRLLAGLAALVGTLAAGVLTFLKPSERAHQHLLSGRRLGQLRVEMRQARDLQLPHQSSEQDMLDQIRRFARQKADIGPC